MGMKTAQTLLDSYAALASGVLIGMAQGMQAESDASEAGAGQNQARQIAGNSGQGRRRGRLPCSPAAHAGPP